MKRRLPREVLELDEKLDKLLIDRTDEVIMHCLSWALLRHLLRRSCCIQDGYQAIDGLVDRMEAFIGKYPDMISRMCKAECKGLETFTDADTDTQH